MSAKADCEKLLNAVLPFAEELLGKEGEFFPYGGAMAPDGAFVSVAADDGREQPPSVDIIHLIKSGFVTGANDGSYKATALVYDVRITLPGDGVTSDAIAIDLDHRDVYSMTVMFPYALEPHGLSIGEPIAQVGEFDIFPT